MAKIPINDIIEWDVENWSRALNFWENHLPPCSPEIRILTLGERNGGLSLWLALKGYHVIYSDRTPPTEKALQLHSTHRVSDLIVYHDVDVFKMPYNDQTFDVVICKSTLGGLKYDPKDNKTRTLDNHFKACEEIRRVLKKGGVFLGAENMKGSHIHNLIRRFFGKDSGWKYLTKDDLNFMFSSYDSLMTEYFGFLSTNTNFRLINTFFGWLNVVTSPLLNNKCLYISFISAKK